jgi:hypothetical protein
VIGMNQLVPILADRAPALAAAVGARASYRFLEFFTLFPVCQKGPHGAAHGWNC